MSQAAEEMFDLDFAGCGLNVTNETILAHVSENIRRGLPQARGYAQNQQTALLVAGGPSLKDTEKDLVEAFWRGGKIVTVNGSYDWCITRNIKPSMQVMIDAREFNARFVETPVDGCHYFLASQCHPKAFQACRGRQVSLWHMCSTGEPEIEMLKAFYFERFNPVTIGTTVSIRAISLLRMLGFMHIEIFGLDSCVMDGRHHAYSQPENDGEPLIPVYVKVNGERSERFLCTVWQAKQATDFVDLVRERGDMLQLKVHGNGLIATTLRLGAEMEMGD